MVRFRFMSKFSDRLGNRLMVILCLRFRVRVRAMNCFLIMAIDTLFLDFVFWMFRFIFGFRFWFRIMVVFGFDISVRVGVEFSFMVRYI